MIGDARALGHASANKSRVFSKCTAAEIEAAAPKLGPSSGTVLLIDSRDIIKRHDGVRNDEVSRLLWALMKNLGTR